MSTKSKKVNEKQKFIFVLLVTAVWFCGLFMFMYKLPKTNDYKQDAIGKDLETMPIKDGVVYEQVFQCDVEKLNLISVLMVNNSTEAIPGTIVIESFDQKGNMIGRNTHAAKNINSVNFVPNVIPTAFDSNGETITVKIHSEGLGDNSELTLAVKSAVHGEKGYVLGNIENENKLMLSYVGEKGDTTYFWCMLMLAAMILPLYIMIDYSKLKKGGK